MPIAINPEAHRLARRYRLMSGFEVLVGAFFVLGHNIFGVVPNEVFFLFALFCISFKLRDGGWRVAGLTRPHSWGKTVLMAVAAVVVLQVGSELVIQPVAHWLWHQSEHVTSLLDSGMSVKQALTSLIIVWTFAAFGEEFGYRGYLLTRAADLGNRSNIAYVGAMLFVSVLFGLGHYYKGPAGVLDSTYSGLVLGSVYLLTGRNLWASILAHGISDTFAVVVVYMGWAN
jgi:membrane protease YdiL (CAAX protease family)